MDMRWGIRGPCPWTPMARGGTFVGGASAGDLEPFMTDVGGLI